MQQYTLGEHTFSEAQLIKQAEDWGVSLKELVEANKDLKVKPLSREELSNTTFQVGDTEFSFDQLSKQAKEWDVSVEELIAANPEMSTTSRVGDILDMQKYEHSNVEDFVDNYNEATGISLFGTDASIGWRESKVKKFLEDSYEGTGIKFEEAVRGEDAVKVTLPNDGPSWEFNLSGLNDQELRDVHTDIVNFIEDKQRLLVSDDFKGKVQKDWEEGSFLQKEGDVEVNLQKTLDEYAVANGWEVGTYEVKEAHAGVDAVTITNGEKTKRTFYIPGGIASTKFKATSTFSDIVNFIQDNPKNFKQNKKYKEQYQSAKEDVYNTMTDELINEVTGTVDIEVIEQRREQWWEEDPEDVQTAIKKQLGMKAWWKSDTRTKNPLLSNTDYDHIIEDAWNEKLTKTRGLANAKRIQSGIDVALKELKADNLSPEVKKEAVENLLRVQEQLDIDKFGEGTFEYAIAKILNPILNNPEDYTSDDIKFIQDGIKQMTEDYEANGGEYTPSFDIESGMVINKSDVQAYPDENLVDISDQVEEHKNAYLQMFEVDGKIDLKKLQGAYHQAVLADVGYDAEMDREVEVWINNPRHLITDDFGNAVGFRPMSDKKDAAASPEDKNRIKKKIRLGDLVAQQRRGIGILFGDVERAGVSDLNFLAPSLVTTGKNGESGKAALNFFGITDTPQAAEDFEGIRKRYIQEKTELASKREALSIMYLTNEDMMSIERGIGNSLVGTNVEQTRTGIVGSIIGMDNMPAVYNQWYGGKAGGARVTKLDVIQDMGMVMDELGIAKTPTQAAYEKLTFGEEINTNISGSAGILLSFAGANKVQAALSGIKLLKGGRSLKQYLSAANSYRFAKVTQTGAKGVKREKVLSKFAVQQEAKALGVPWAEHAFNNYVKIRPSGLKKAQAILINTGLEGIKFGAIGGDPAVGAGFGLAGQLMGPVWSALTPTTLFGKNIAETLSKNSYYAKTLASFPKGGINFMIGSEVGELANGLVDEMLGVKEFKTFLDHEYADYDQVTKRWITNFIVGNAFNLTHVLGSNTAWDTYSGISRAKNAAYDNMMYSWAKNKKVKGKRIFIDKNGNEIKPDKNGKIDNKKLVVREDLSLSEYYKHKEIYQMAEYRLAVMDGNSKYYDPILNREANMETYRPNIEAAKEKGHDVEIETDWSGKMTQNAEWSGPGDFGKPKTNAKGQQVHQLKINPYTTNPNVAIHELGHFFEHAVWGKDARVKSKVLRAWAKTLDMIEIDAFELKVLMKDVEGKVDIEKLPSGRITLLDWIKAKKFDPENRVNNNQIKEWEMFTYLSEYLGNKKHYDRLMKSDAYAKLGEHIQKEVGGRLDKEFDLTKVEDVIGWFGNYQKSINKGEGWTAMEHIKGQVVDYGKTRYTKMARLKRAETAKKAMEKFIGKKTGLKSEDISADISTQEKAKADALDRFTKGKEGLDPAKDKDKIAKLREKYKNEVDKINAEIERIKAPFLPRTLDEEEKKRDRDLHDDIIEVNSFELAQAEHEMLFDKKAPKGKMWVEAENRILEGTKDVVGKITEYNTKRLFDKISFDAAKTLGDTRAEQRKRYKEALADEINTMIKDEWDVNKQGLEKFVSVRGSLRAESLAKRLGVLSIKQLKKHVPIEKGKYIKADVSPILEKFNTEDLSISARFNKLRTEDGKELGVEAKEKVIKLNIPPEYREQVLTAINNKGILKGKKRLIWDEVGFKDIEDLGKDITAKILGGKGWSIKATQSRAEHLAENAEGVHGLMSPYNVAMTGRFSGKAIGIDNTLITDQNTKADVLYKKVAEGAAGRTKFDPNEGGAGNPVQKKIEFDFTTTSGRNKYLENFGIKIKPDGTVDASILLEKITAKDGTKIASPRARKYQNRLDKLGEQFGKNYTSVTIDRLIKEGVVAPELNIHRSTIELLETTTAGRESGLASEFIDGIQRKFGYTDMQVRDNLMKYAVDRTSKDLDSRFKKYLNKSPLSEEGSFFDSPEAKAMFYSEQQTALIAKKHKENFKTNYLKGVKEADLPTIDGKKITLADMRKLIEDGRIGTFKSDYTTVDVENPNFNPKKPEGPDNQKMIKGVGLRFYDIKKLENYMDHAVEWSKLLHPDFKTTIENKLKGVLEGITGVHDRTTANGNWIKKSKKTGEVTRYVLDTKSDPVVSNFFVQEFVPRLLKEAGTKHMPEWGREVEGKQVFGKFEAVKEATQRKAVENEIKESDPTKRLDLIKKTFSKEENQKKEDINFNLGLMNEVYLEGAKSKKEWLDRAAFVFNKASFETNIVGGKRQYVKVLAVQKDAITGEKTIKLEHMKINVLHTVGEANLAIRGMYRSNGREWLENFVGIIGEKTIGPDIMDKKGASTNPSNLARLHLLGRQVLESYVVVEGPKAYEQNLFDYSMERIAKENGVSPKVLKKLHLADQVNDYLFNHNEITRFNLQEAIKNASQLKQLRAQTLNLIPKPLKRLASEDLTNSQLRELAKNTDKAIAHGRKIDKIKKGMSAWDFDDTLARTKSGVRYTLPNPSGKPAPKKKAIFMAGGPGAGKSTVIKGLGLEKQGFKVVNQDISLQWLAKNHGLPTDMRDFTPEQASKWGSLGWDARMIAKRKQAKYQGQGDGIIVDGTGASLQSMRNQVQEFKNKGYDVQMMFVETSKDVAIERNRLRKERSLRTGIVIKTWDSVMKNKEAFKEMFGERFTEVNTDKLKQNDPMPTKVVGKMDAFTKGYKKGRLDPGEYADKGEMLEAQGAKFDFTEFDYVKEGEKGPLFGKAMERAKKFGLKDQFVITARPHAAKMPIYRFLDAQGLNIPFDNIITLENSSAAAKAKWMVEKFAEGYNDMYFADDALQNVEAVREVMSQLDVKSKVQQAKRLASENLGTDFNKIVEETTGFKAGYEVGKAKARILGKDKRSQSIILPGAQDFMGLMYNFMGKGKQGETHKKFFEDNLQKPFARGWNDMLTHRQTILDDFKRLKKITPEINGGLAKTGNKYRHGASDIVKLKTPSTWKNVPNSKYSYEQAVRVYLWNKGGFEAPGLSKTDAKSLNEIVMNDPILRNYADKLGALSKESKGYIEPGQFWFNETIMSDVYKLTQERGMKKYLAEFIENKNIIFSEANMQKIEATQGRPFREALEDIMWRMEHGTNRPSGNSRETSMFMNWINGSVGATMNWNMRSAVIQQLSTMNFLNWTDNNPLMAGKAFANQPQFWRDYSTIWNSSVMRQRRKGLKINVHESEIADAVSTGGVRGAFNYFLKLGFTPTMIADSHAISFGGSTFYRNRINTYLKKGFDKTEAQEQAFKDFQTRSEPTQQSSRPDLVSKWQADPILGRLIFPFSNVNTQNARRGEKGVRDAKNKRGDMKDNISKAGLYGLLQPLMYGGLSAGLIGLYLDEDEDFTEKEKQDKVWRTANTMLDSQLRGLGYPGAVASAAKNTFFEYHKQSNKPNPDHTYTMLQMTSVSPVVNIKLRNIYSGLQTTKYNKKVIEAMPYWDLDNPHWFAKAQIIQGTTNMPTGRFMYKRMNMKEAIDADNQWWQRAHHVGGWAPWDLGTEIEEIEAYKESVKKEKKGRGRARTRTRTRTR